MDHPRAVWLAKLAMVAFGMASLGCTASYRAVTATGLDRPYQSLACRARGEPPPPVALDSVVLAPIPRFHPVPVRPVLLPEGAAIEIVDPRSDTVIPPIESAPPVDREVPAQRSPSDSDSPDLLVRRQAAKPDETPALPAAANRSAGWRAAQRQ